jgi:hypothetical protein
MLDAQNTLVFVAVGFAALVFLLAACVILFTPVKNDTEIVKLRFAQVMFVGIITVFIFSAILYVSSPDGPGKVIFDKAITAMTPLAGVIIGYLFGNRDASGDKTPPSEGDETSKTP